MRYSMAGGKTHTGTLSKTHTLQIYTVHNTSCKKLYTITI